MLKNEFLTSSERKVRASIQKLATLFKTRIKNKKTYCVLEFNRHLTSICSNVYTRIK